MVKRILTNGRFYSFKSGSIFADTIEIIDGKISKVGKQKDILGDDSNTKTKTTDLNRSLVLPGFSDSHIHLLAYGQSLLHVDLTHTVSKAECLARIRSAVSETPAGGWILGHGWNHNKWADGYGNKKDLDALTQQHPIYLTHKSLHCAWTNSIALKIAGITSGFVEPADGVVMREKNNQPSGILLESAMLLVQNAIPAPSDDQVIAALLAAQNSLNKYGITAVHDFDPWNVYDALEELRGEKRTTLRVMKNIPKTELPRAIENGLMSGIGNEWLRTGWLKLFADGALGPQTAAMLKPYEGSNKKGMLLLEKNDVLEIGNIALRARISLAVHAIGDHANREILSAFEILHIEGLLQQPLLSPRVEHVQIVSPEDIQLFNQTNTIASMQPIHAVSDMDMADRYWGKRCETAYAWRTILDSNATLIFGSDAPVETPNPMEGIAAAISRRKMTNTEASQIEYSWTTHQCITLFEALKAYCYSPSRISGFRDASKGVCNGSFADLVILPEDFLKFTPEEINRTRPYATMVNGNWVYKNDKIDLKLV